MPFAPVNFDLSYWQKQSAERPLFPDLSWNIPEQKTGHLTIIGGSERGVGNVVRLAEAASTNFPFQKVEVILPSTLERQLPPLPNLSFAPATSTGSFDKSTRLREALTSGDFIMLLGDFSRNSATAVALTDAIASSLPPASAQHPSTTGQSGSTPPPLLITRDAVDLLAPSGEIILAHPRLFLVASLAQLQKLFRAVFYPKMIMLSQPLVPIIETLHKFTLTYPATILTLHEGKILVAHSGQITSTPLADTSYTPLSIWAGALATAVAAYNLYNPTQPLAATTAALLTK